MASSMPSSSSSSTSTSNASIATFLPSSTEMDFHSTGDHRTVSYFFPTDHHAQSSLDFKLNSVSTVLRAYFSGLSKAYSVSLVRGRIVVYKSKTSTITFVLTYSERWAGITLRGEVVASRASYAYGRFNKEHLEALRKDVQKALEVSEPGWQ